MIRSLLVFFLLAIASPAWALNFGFGFAAITGTTTLGGSVTTTLKVPGTFVGVNDNTPTAGRYLKSAFIWADSPANGDEISTLQIVDTDGVIPVPVRAALPNYPVVFDMIDPAVSGTPTTYLPSEGLLIEAFDSNGAPTVRFVPSGLYFKVTFKSGGLLSSKTFRAVVRWGYWQ